MSKIETSRYLCYPIWQSLSLILTSKIEREEVILVPQTRRRRRVNPWAELLDQARRDLGDRCRLQAVIVLNNVTKIVSCYGRQIDDGILFKVLNLSTNATIKYRLTKELPRYREGIYVPLQVFNPDADPDEVVILVRFAIEPTDFVAVRFKVG